MASHGALFPVALAIALYTVAATMRRAAALAAAVLTAGVLLSVVGQDGTRHWGLAISDAVGFAAAVLIVGLYVGTRRAYLAELRDRAQRLERERDQTSALAAATERARIAREMHDSVAHHLTIIVALSDGALAAVARAPEEASDAIRDVSSTAREALAETRRLFGVLRADSGQELRQPLPGLADLDDLLARVRDGRPAGALRAQRQRRGPAARHPARRLPAGPGSPDEHHEARRPRRERHGPAAAHPGGGERGSRGRRHRQRTGNPALPAAG